MLRDSSFMMPKMLVTSNRMTPMGASNAGDIGKIVFLTTWQLVFLRRRLLKILIHLIQDVAYRLIHWQSHQQSLSIASLSKPAEGRFGIERHPYTKSRIDQILCVCMCVCVCNYSETTEPICIKIIPANRASCADCYWLLRFKIFTPTIFTTPKTFLGARNVKPMGNKGLHISGSNWARKLKFGTWIDMIRSFNNVENVSTWWRMHTTMTPSWILALPLYLRK